jgi:hypothetical protein
MINLTYFRYFTLFLKIKGGMKSPDQRIPNWTKYIVAGFLIQN